MKFLSFLLILTAAAVADDQPLSKAHIIAEAKAKQALVERLQQANFQLTDNQKRYDAVFYSLDLFPDVASQTLYGDVSMQAIARVRGLDAVDLNFLDDMIVDSIFCNGAPVGFTHADDILTMKTDKAVDIDELFTTRIVYHGKPSHSGFGAFGFDTHAGKPMIWSLSEPFGARNWWPCKDAPIDKADSVDIRVKVRSDLIVASNGALVDVTEAGGFKTYYWQERYPIVTYLVSLAIHPYYTYSDWYVNGENDSMEVQYYVFQNDVSRAKSENAKTVKMIQVFAEIFGEYPFIKEKYGHAQFLWGGGMEHQTITSLGGYSESLIVHELAHQWWGDMVTCEDFHHIWLNEGFATYSEALWWESQYGQAALHQDMANNAYLGPETIYIENPLTDNIFYYQTTYAKAAWVLHMLRHVVGDDIFFQILKTYYREFKFKTVTTEQFKNLCERVSGCDLDRFFTQWIYQEGVPHYEYLWWTEKLDDSRWLVKGHIRQAQAEPEFFAMPVDISIKTTAGDETVVLVNDQREQAFEFIVAAEPTHVIVDEKNWILKRLTKITEPILQVIDVTLTDKDGAPQAAFAPGSEGRLFFSLQNFGVRAENVSAHLTTIDAALSIAVSSIPVGEVNPGESLHIAESAFAFKIEENAPSHLATVYVTFEYLGGSSAPFAVQIPMGAPTLLIIDDDGGADYEKYYRRSALQKGEFATVWSVIDEGLPLLQTLADYDYVAWFTGDDSTTSLTKEEQALIDSYLGVSGKLLLSGRGIGYDLVEDGDQVDEHFFTTVLHAAYDAEIVADLAVVGVPGDPLGDGLAVRFEDIGDGAGNQKNLRSIAPMAPAATAFFYLPSRKGAGVRWTGAADARLVYLAFGLEGIEGPRETSASDLLTRVLQWFVKGDPVHAEEDGRQPASFVLEQNFPNPFNPSTAVRFYNPAPAILQVDIYNARGQRVMRLFEDAFESGWHILTWDGLVQDGSAAASGVYILTIRGKSAYDVEKSVKMLKLN